MSKVNWKAEIGGGGGGEPPPPAPPPPPPPSLENATAVFL